MLNTNRERFLKCGPSPNNIIESNSSLVFGRCSSTPIDCNNIPFSPELSIDEILPRYEKCKPPPLNLENKLKTPGQSLNPKIDFAPVPIFGRRNLQLLSECASKNEKAESKGQKKLGFEDLSQASEKSPITPNADVSNDFIDLLEIKKADPTNHGKHSERMKTSKNYGESSKNFTTPDQRFVTDRRSKLKKLTDKICKNSPKFVIKRNDKSRKSINNRKSILKTSQKPVLKIPPKCQKSPRLLTAMRASMRTKKDKKIPLKSEDIENNLGERSGTKRRQTICKTRITPQNPSLRRVTKYNITVPISPKLGKRRLFNSLRQNI